jgi:glucose-specific phosphotransferase system IIA component
MTKCDEIKQTERDEKSAAGEYIASPITGEVVALKELHDSMFAEGVLGKGVAINPREGKVISPVNGRVSVVCETKHAIGLVSEGGAEVFIHIGMDTVNLGGKYFKPYVKQDDEVKVGDLLIEFDLEGIKAEGYHLITPIVIANTTDYTTVAPVASGNIRAKENLLEVK